MNGSIVTVGYPYVYDLYYRVRHARLESEVYQIEFIDWVKAGIAFNTRSKQDVRRKISYFGQLYHAIQRGPTASEKHMLQLAVMDFYEDLFLLYQDHLTAQLKRAKKKGSSYSTVPQNLVLLPTFSQSKSFLEFVPTKEVVVSEYQCLHDVDLREAMSTIYAVEGSPLWRCMGMLFDYGVCHEENGVLLEVM